MILGRDSCWAKGSLGALELIIKGHVTQTGSTFGRDVKSRTLSIFIIAETLLIARIRRARRGSEAVSYTPYANGLGVDSVKVSCVHLDRVSYHGSCKPWRVPFLPSVKGPPMESRMIISESRTGNQSPKYPGALTN